MHSQAIRASSHVSSREASRLTETQKRTVARTVRSQKHALGGQQVAVKRSTAIARRATELNVVAKVEKPKLPYDVGSQGGVGVLGPTLEPVSVDAWASAGQSTPFSRGWAILSY
eukprot:2177832-Pyramimonas_sp.AAC.2